MYLAADKFQPGLPPRGDVLTSAQADVARSVVADLTQAKFDRRILTPQVAALTDRIGSACTSSEDQGRMCEEIDRWVHWYRLPGYWLAFLLQDALHQQNSPYFVLACRIYADAQINMNSDLSLPSLENGYLPLKAHLAKGGDPVVQTIADDLLRHMRTAFAYYRRWYSETAYGSANPLTEHLYSEKTWSELTAAFPELLKRDEAAAFLDAIDECSKADAVYYSVVARRFLGNWYEGKNRLQEAEQTYRLALAQARDSRLETEIGHLLRLHGYTLQKMGELNEAERLFRRALSYESHPECIYWQALSARELGDVLIRKLPREMDPKNPPKELGTVLEVYRVGRSLFESHVASGIIPVARAVKQELFRSYVDNAIQLTMLSGGPDSIAEIEAEGPRYVTDVIAESRAAIVLGADAYTKYLRSRAVFHSALAASNPTADLEDDFRNYIGSLAPNREARQFYMRTRIALTAPITHAQLSDELAAKFYKQKFPNAIFMMFHIGRADTFMTVADRERNVSTLGKVKMSAEDWKHCNAEFQTALRRASSGPLPHPEMVREAIDVLLAKYELGLPPRLRQTDKTLLAVRCNFIVPDPGTVLGWACR